MERIDHKDNQRLVDDLRRKPSVGGHSKGVVDRLRKDNRLIAHPSLLQEAHGEGLLHSGDPLGTTTARADLVLHRRRVIPTRPRPSRLSLCPFPRGAVVGSAPHATASRSAEQRLARRYKEVGGGNAVPYLLGFPPSPGGHPGQGCRQPTPGEGGGGGGGGLTKDS